MNFAPPPSSSSLIIHSSVDPARPDMCFWFDKCAIKTRRLAEKEFSRRPKTARLVLARRRCALCGRRRAEGGAELYGQRPMTELRGATLIRRGADRLGFTNSAFEEAETPSERRSRVIVAAFSGFLVVEG